MDRLIIDVTQLAHWQGKLTGIPRVMNELASRYAMRPECCFVVWSNATQEFCEVDAALSLEHRGHSIHYVKEQRGPVAAQHSTNLSGNSGLGDKLKPLAARVVNKARAYEVAPVNKLLNRAVAYREKGNKKVQPGRGDTLFVLWGEQANEGFTQKLLDYQHDGVKLVQIVYDLLPLITPQYSGHSTESMRQYTRKVIPVCDLVLAISKHTKQDLAEWLIAQKLPVPRIEVFRLGDDFHAPKPAKPTSEPFIKSRLAGQDYILCVGTIEARKNHTLLYYVYKLAHQKGITLPKLIVAGRRGWKTEDIYEIISTDPETLRELVLLSDMTDEELTWLYGHCLFSVYPSFYEGWGLPIAESIAHGKPCVASSTSSMPEVAGDLIEYFSPASTDECLQAIQKLLRPAELAAATERVQAYKPTPWDDTFKQVDNLIGEI